jgi:hypothetical protein
MWLLLGVVDWASAKSKYRNKPPEQIRVQYDPEVLREYQQRFGKTEVGERYLKKQGTNIPKIVGTRVGSPTSAVDQILEMPILPQTVGGFPYRHKFKWGKQKTLTELLNPAPKGPTKQPIRVETKTTISQ